MDAKEELSESKLQDILKQCTDRGNIPLSDKEKLFENLWREQSERLNKHEKYLAESTEIYPIAEFVCKARIRNKNESIQESKKVFLNICSHHLIPNLSVSQIDIHQNGKTEQGIRFPMSSGPQMMTKDNKNIECATYDIVFHPDVISNAAKDETYKMNICMTAAQNISQKHEVIIEGPFKFPMCAYKGIDANHKEPLPQRIRKKGAAKYVQDDDDNNLMSNSSKDLPIEYIAEKKVKNEVGNQDDAKSDQASNKIALEHDFYIVFVDEKRKKLKIENGFDGLKIHLNECKNQKNAYKDIAAIHIHIDLTDKYTLNDLDLNTNGDGICLHHKKRLLFRMKWNDICQGMSKMIDDANINAKFKKKKNLLKIYCPFS